MPLTTGWEGFLLWKNSHGILWLFRTTEPHIHPLPLILVLLRTFCSPLPPAHRKQKKGFSSLPQAADEDLTGQNYKTALKYQNSFQQDSHFQRDVLFTSSPSLLLSSLPTQPLCRKLQSWAEGKKLNLLQTKQLFKRPDGAVKARNKSLSKGCDVRGSSIQQVTRISGTAHTDVIYSSWNPKELRQPLRAQNAPGLFDFFFFPVSFVLE